MKKEHLMKLVMAIVASLSLAACVSEKWTKPNSSPNEFDATKSYCTSRASQKFPPMMGSVALGYGYNAPTSTMCNGYGNMVNCTTMGGGYQPPPTLPVDYNANARNEEIRACLYENGWEPTKSH